MTEIETLRVSIARIAQALDLDDMIPGATSTERLPYEGLAQLASNHRGWNFLCAMIVRKIKEGENV